MFAKKDFGALDEEEEEKAAINLKEAEELCAISEEEEEGEQGEGKGRRSGGASRVPPRSRKTDEQVQQEIEYLTRLCRAIVQPRAPEE